jgi:hypothetical protein
MLPPARRFALTACLWFAAWGLAVTALLVISAFLLFGATYAHEIIWPHQRQSIGAAAFGTSGQGLLFVLLIVLLAAFVAVAVAILHGILTRRLTFALFHLYLTAVAFVVGLLIATPSVFALVARLHLRDSLSYTLAIPAALMLSGSLAWFCSSRAQDFRGERPDRFNPITPAEYHRI